MSSITEIQAEIVAEFNDFSDWQEKYEFIIDLGFELKPLSDEHKIEEKRIMGCQSNVWLNAYYDQENAVMRYEADSEAMIVKGLISLLIQVLSGQKPEAIISEPLDFLSKIGLDQHLSATRSNGLASMIQRMKQEATLHLSQSTT